MKKSLFLTAFSLLCASASYGQGTITLTTSAEPGTKVRMLINVTSATAPVTIDYGNGVEVKETIDPTQMAYNRWIEGAVEGETITIKGYITEFTMNEAKLTSAHIDGMSKLVDLDLAKNEITDFQLLSTTPLESLNLSNNNVTNNTFEHPTLTLENAGETLSSLSISHNPGLICLKIDELRVLEYLSANDCPDLGSVFICLPEESRPMLRSINLSNCNLAHFYPVSLPSLRTLNLSNNYLMTAADSDPFVLGDYPELTSLDISSNQQITELDITSCKKLESFSASNNKLSSIDLSQAPELSALYLANNKFTSLDLGNNKKIKYLNISGNDISELDLEPMTSLQSVNISDTKISRVMLMYAYYLTDFVASNTLLEFVDFNGQQANRMNKIDLRNNSRMTAESMDYTLFTLPVAKSSSWNSDPNLLLSGSNAEHATTSYATSSDLGWICDVTGDGTATHDPVAVTIDATDTGENKTGTGYKLYPYFGMTIDYDLDVYSTDGGTFLISQWLPPYYQYITTVSNEARVGVPIHIYPYPEEGKRFKSVTVNGEEIKSDWFVIYEPATIKVNFVAEEASIKLTTNPGQNMSFLVNTSTNNGTVWVDWGTGTRTEYPGQNKYQTGYVDIKGTRIDGSAASSDVIIYGDIAAINLEGWGDAAEYFGTWDNAIKAIDLSNAPELKYLNLYWNPITDIDLSTVPELEFLDVSFTALQSLDLSHTPNIMWLDAYSDGYGDPADGIAQLTSIDVSNQPYLQYLNVKGNLLTSIDVSKNTWLSTLILNNNKISSVDLRSNTDLNVLRLSGNELTSLDLSKNTALEELTVADNNLTSLDLSANTALVELNFANNDIHAIDLSANEALKTLYINGNGMTACELNDVYYLLPQRQADDDDNSGSQLSWNLAVVQGGDKAENEGLRADSSIAVDRGWTPSHQGTNGGCDVAYLDILPSAHGSFTVTDQFGNIYGNGSRVPKYEALTIEATAEDGYKMVAFTLNGEDPVYGNSFDMPGVYTKLAVTFAKDSGVEDAVASSIDVIAANGRITVTAADAVVSVYNAAGISVAEFNVNGSETVDLASGLYIVKVVGADSTLVKKVTVK